MNEWERWWNDTDKGKPNYSEKNLSSCHFVRRTSHVDRPRMESAAPVPVCRTQIPHILVWDGIRRPSANFFNTNLIWTGLDGIRCPNASLSNKYTPWNGLGKNPISQCVPVSLFQYTSSRGLVWDGIWSFAITGRPLNTWATYFSWFRWVAL